MKYDRKIVDGEEVITLKPTEEELKDILVFAIDSLNKNGLVAIKRGNKIYNFMVEDLK